MEAPSFSLRNALLVPHDVYVFKLLKRSEPTIRKWRRVAHLRFNG